MTTEQYATVVRPLWRTLEGLVPWYARRQFRAVRAALDAAIEVRASERELDGVAVGQRHLTVTVEQAKADVRETYEAILRAHQQGYAQGRGDVNGSSASRGAEDRTH